MVSGFYGDSLASICASEGSHSLMGGSTVVMCVPLGRPAQRMAGVLGVQCWLGLLYTTVDCTLLVVQWGPLSLMLFNGPTPTM